MADLVRYLPKGIKLNDHQMNPVIFKGVITGIDGGYAYNQYAMCEYENKRGEFLYINVAIADSTFKLKEVYEDLSNKTVSGLGNEAFQFLSNVRLNSVIWECPGLNEITDSLNA